MPFISIDVFAPVNHTLPQEATKMIQDLAEQELRFIPANTLVQFRFASPDEQWFFGSDGVNPIPLDRNHEPSFHVHTFVIDPHAAGVNLGQFALNTFDQFKMLLATTYPGSSLPDDFHNRNKVTIVEPAG